MNLIVCLIYREIDTVKVSHFCLKRRVLVQIDVGDEHLRLKIDLISLVFRLLDRVWVEKDSRHTTGKTYFSHSILFHF